jgi:peptidoglycan/xylan/chitin deacetylase (PgdA/CDA1 family)
LTFGLRRLPFKKGSLTILTFHRVQGVAHPLIPDWPTASQFAEKLKWFSQITKVVSLSDALAKIRRSDFNEHLGAITFDDGYIDNLEVAVPVLKAFDLRATFFIATAYVGEGLIFDDAIIQSLTVTDKEFVSVPELGFNRSPILGKTAKLRFANEVIEKLKYVKPEVRNRLTKEITKNLTDKQLVGSMMGEQHLRRLGAAGMQVESHSHEHFVGTVLTLEEFRKDCEKSVGTLSAIMGVRPTIFAFPNGIPAKDFNAQHIDVVKSLGFDGAVSTQPGVANVKSNRFSLPRLIPWQSNRYSFLFELMKQRWKNSL